MAEEQAPKEKRRLRTSTETVREKVEKVSSAEPKPRRLRENTRKVTAPVRAAGRGLGKLGKFKPFRIVGLILVPPYFRNSWKELRQVTWPGRKETLKLTSSVIIFSVIFGALVALTDYGLDKVFRKVLINE